MFTADERNQNLENKKIAVFLDETLNCRV